MHILGDDVTWDEDRTYTLRSFSTDDDDEKIVRQVPISLDFYDPSIDALIADLQAAPRLDPALDFLKAEMLDDRKRLRVTQAAMIVRAIAEYTPLSSIDFALPTIH